MSTPLFELGQTLITPGAEEVLRCCPLTIQSLLTRHVTGDWSEMCQADQAENRFSVSRPLRVFSSYKLVGQLKIWVITEADRSATTILLPEEY